MKGMYVANSNSYNSDICNGYFKDKQIQASILKILDIWNSFVLYRVCSNLVRPIDYKVKVYHKMNYSLICDI